MEATTQGGKKEDKNDDDDDDDDEASASLESWRIVDNNGKYRQERDEQEACERFQTQIVCALLCRRKVWYGHIKRHCRMCFQNKTTQPC